MAFPPGAHTLHVFDFDGTLFRSPMPNPKNHSSSDIGRLKSEGGWFHQLPSLVPPAVPHEPGDDWFIPYIKEKAHEVIADTCCVAVLLTGRGEKYTERILDICRTGGLVFERAFLKPKGNTTLPWKKTVIRNMIDEGGFRNVHIYEDRPRHAEGFRAFLEEVDGLEERVVVEVTEPDRYIPDEDEKVVVAELLKLMRAEGRKLPSNRPHRDVSKEVSDFLASNARTITLKGLTAYQRKDVHCHAERARILHESVHRGSQTDLVLTKPAKNGDGASPDRENDLDHLMEGLTLQSDARPKVVKE